LKVLQAVVNAFEEQSRKIENADYPREDESN
jgi:hypothetical protein